MGSRARVTSRRCQTTFETRTGGGFVFDVLHCEQCGAERSVSHADLGDLYLRWLKGLDVPYAIARAGFDASVQRDFQGEPLSDDQYRAAVSEFVGPCRCGGRFTYKARPRWPKCGSGEDDWETTGSVVLYD